MEKGTIKTLNSTKMYGFIKGYDGKEYFFHKANVRGFFEEFSIGSLVEFEIVKNNPRGPRASDVRLVDEHGIDDTQRRMNNG